MTVDGLPASSGGSSFHYGGDALTIVRDIMNVVERHYENSETLYKLFRIHSDGDSLVGTLKNGLRYEELVQIGRIPFEDASQHPWSDA